MILTLAEILNRNTQSAIQGWLDLLQREEKMTSVPMDNEQRCGYLPQVFRELISRLQSSQVIGGEGRVSIAAAKHGRDRRRQGYSAAMLVEESRLLEVSIFQMLQNHRASIDFRLALAGVMVIADEIDSQLSQAIASYTVESLIDHRPLTHS
jgi:RsbT co-antagonist protein rsbRD N-terminal domain